MRRLDEAARPVATKGPPPASPARAGGEPLTAAARQFEAVFLRQMIAAMRAPSLGDDLFGSDASAQFRDMSDARLAEAMAGGFGIATMIEHQLGGPAK